MEKRIKIGIVGCGRWGRNIIRTLIELRAGYPLDILSVVTTGKPENARIIEEQFGLRCETDLSGLLDQNPRAVFITTPDETHFEIAHRILERGISAFVEKPIALTLPETEKLIEIAAQKNAIVSTGHLLMFHPCISLIYDRLQAYGQRPKAIFSSRLAQIGLKGGQTVLRSSLVHDLAMVDFFLKSVPTSISRRTFFNPMPHSEYVDLFMEFPAGENAHLVGSSIWPEQERVFALWTADYYFHFNGLTNAVKTFKRSGNEFILENEEKPQGQALSLELENFIQALSDPAMLRVNSEHMLRVMRTIDLIEQEAR